MAADGGGFHWSLGESLQRQVDAHTLEDWSLGETIDRRYVLLEQLGAGTTGVVYRARDSGSEREVALKALGSAGDAERFQREGELAAALDHPGIGRVFSSGSDRGRAFIVYELLEGCRPLSEAYPGMSRPRRLEVLLQVAEAVGHAHGKGVVHRDLKPANVVIDAAARTRVIDFGVGRRDSADDPRITRAGDLVGTPLYMAPEQFAGDEHTQAVDVWALGVLLYLFLTDRHPFKGSSLRELAARVVSAPLAPPSKLDPTVSPALERVCLRALRRAPADRPADARAFAEELRRALDPEAPSRWAGLAGVAALLSSAAALVGAAALAASPVRPEPQPERAPPPQAAAAPGPQPASPPPSDARRLLDEGLPRAALDAIPEAPGGAPDLRRVLEALLAEPRDEVALLATAGPERRAIARWLTDEGRRRAAFVRDRQQTRREAAQGALPFAQLRQRALADLRLGARLTRDPALLERVGAAQRWCEASKRVPSPEELEARSRALGLDRELSAMNRGADPSAVFERLGEIEALDPKNPRARLIRAVLTDVLEPSGFVGAVAGSAADPLLLPRLHNAVRERVLILSRFTADPLLTPLSDRLPSGSPAQLAARAMAVELEGADAVSTLADLDVALASRPGHLVLRVLRVHVAGAAGRDDRAEADLRALAEEVPDNALAAFYAGLHLARRGERASRVSAALEFARTHEGGRVRGEVTAHLIVNRGLYPELQPYRRHPAFRPYFPR
jgi:serine/threonine-protein kinase